MSWAGNSIYEEHRTRGAVCLERVGASLSTTMRAQVEASWHQGNQGSTPSRTSQSASMVRSRGGRSWGPFQKAMPVHACDGANAPHMDASGGESLDVAYRQSRTPETRPGRCGMAQET